jgi:hypothetical protein
MSSLIASLMMPWCLGWSKPVGGAECWWRGSGCVGGQGNWETVRGTNVDGVMLVVVVVEKRAAGVVWCGSGEYQLEIGSMQKGSRSADKSQRGSPGA